MLGSFATKTARTELGTGSLSRQPYASRALCNQIYERISKKGYRVYVESYLSTSIPFRLLATISNRNDFSLGLSGCQPIVEKSEWIPGLTRTSGVHQQ